MSTTQREFQVPVIIDVTADDRTQAGEIAVMALGGFPLVGQEAVTADGMGRVESWWTVEAIDKHADGNDNDPGIVLFDADLDYLRDVLIARYDGHVDDDTWWSDDEPERIERLMRYLTERIGSATLEDGDDEK